jgi:hypothetical protein
MTTEKSSQELAAEAARTISLTLGDGDAAPTAARPRSNLAVAVAPNKARPDAFKAIFERAHAKLGEAYAVMRDSIASEKLALCDARPNLADAKFPRDRWPVTGGRMLDGIVYLVIPMGKTEWRASFGRECVNYGTISRNTNKRQPIMPQYGDTVIAYVHTTNAEQTPMFVEVDPVDVTDVDAWVEARVADMMNAIVRQRSP